MNRYSRPNDLRRDTVLVCEKGVLSKAPAASDCGRVGYSSIVSLCLNLRLARSAERKQNWLPKRSISMRGRSRTVR